MKKNTQYSEKIVCTWGAEGKDQAAGTACWE